MILYCEGSLSLTSARFGAGIDATLDASSPYPIDLFDPACSTRPEAVVHSLAGTLHVCAAAATNIARPAAPPCRMGTQLFGVAVLPPALWPEYFVSS